MSDDVLFILLRRNLEILTEDKSVERVKVSRLEDAELDYWVAKAGGTRRKFRMHPLFPGGDPECLLEATTYEFRFRPSRMWEDGGPIIEREGIKIWPSVQRDKFGWYAQIMQKFDYEHQHEGRTPLIAAMRCYVASKFGDTVATGLEHSAGSQESIEDK